MRDRGKGRLWSGKIGIIIDLTYTNDLHVLKLLKNVQSEPKLNSYLNLENKNLYSYFICYYNYYYLFYTQNFKILIKNQPVKNIMKSPSYNYINFKFDFY